MDTIKIIAIVVCVILLCISVAFIILKNQTTSISSIGTGGNLPITNGLWKKGSKVWNTFHDGSNNRFSVTNGLLRLEYAKNSYAAKSGGSFSANPRDSLPKDEVTLSYSVEFPGNFDFKKGGKLPGVCIGSTNKECSAGGDWRKGEGSIRVMWRANNGKNPYAIGYVYTTHGDPKKGAQAQGPQSKGSMSPSERTGHNFWKQGSPFKLRHGWNTIRVYIKLNTPGRQDGIYEMSVNGVTKRVNDAVFREKNEEMVQTFKFVSFFGGGDSSWATPNKQLYVNFKDISFS
jgi:hypothetical protein